MIKDSIRSLGIAVHIVEGYRYTIKKNIINQTMDLQDKYGIRGIL